MNRSAAVLPLMLLLFSHTPLSQITSGPPLSGLSTVDRQNREQERKNDRDLDRRVNTVRDLERTARLQTDRMRNSGYKEPELKSEAKERVKKLRRIDQVDLSRYAQFLKDDNTGIFKLFPNYNCVMDGLIKVDGDCENFVPMSSDFSFRQKAYIDSRYSDIQFVGDELRSTAFFTQGILLSLGDVEIEGVSLEGVSEIVRIVPAKNFNDASSTALELWKATEAGGWVYSSRIKPMVNVTYAIRVIAYKVANSFPPITEETSQIQLRLMSLAFDKRSDEIIVFRIVRRDDLGGLTIVWKLLQKNDAPKIKFSKTESLKDFHSEKQFD